MFIDSGIQKLVLFDYNFITPGCTIGAVPFSSLYFGTIIYMVMVGVFFVVCALAYQYRKRVSDTERWVMRPSHPRVVRALIAAVHVTYLQITIRTLQVLHCTDMRVTDTETSYRLAVERATVVPNFQHLCALTAPDVQNSFLTLLLHVYRCAIKGSTHMLPRSHSSCW